MLQLQRSEFVNEIITNFRQIRVNALIVNLPRKRLFNARRFDVLKQTVFDDRLERVIQSESCAAKFASHKQISSSLAMTLRMFGFEINLNKSLSLPSASNAGSGKRVGKRFSHINSLQLF
jgi:hypothetical protein